MRRLIFLSLLLLAACEGAKQDMYDQPRYKPMAASSLFNSGSSAQPPPSGAVARARGPFADSSGGRKGAAAVAQDDAANASPRQPYPLTLALLQRGQNRYTVYCVPCHSPLGDGDGLVVRRGFPSPPSFHTERLRGAADRHLYEVISHGYGVMYPFADRIAPPDRWAIVAYLRALQLSQSVAEDQLPTATRARLQNGGGQP